MKKFFALFLAIALMLCAVSGAMATDAFYLGGADADDPEDAGDIEAADGNPENGYKGYAYTARYVLPEMQLWAFRTSQRESPEAWEDINTYYVDEGGCTYTLKYTLSNDIGTLTATESTSGDQKILTISGTLPDTAGTYTFGIIAEVATVSNNYASGAVGTQYVFPIVDTITVTDLQLAYGIYSSSEYDADPDFTADASNVYEGYAGRSLDIKYTIAPGVAVWQYNAAEGADTDDTDIFKVIDGATFTWSLSPDISGLSVAQSGNTLTISGTLPTTTTAEQEISFGFVATASVTGEYAAANGIQKAFDEAGTITIKPVDLKYAISSADSYVAAYNEETGLITAAEDNPEGGLSGRTYEAKFTIPELALWQYNADDEDGTDTGAIVKINSNFEWTISSDKDVKFLTATVNGTDLTLNGTLPRVSTATTYTCSFVVTAKDVDSQYSAAEGTSLDFYNDTFEFTVSPALYSLATSEGPTSEPEATAADDNVTDSFEGYNFKTQYTVPKLVWWEYDEEDESFNIDLKKDLDVDYEIEWTVSSDSDALKAAKVTVTEGTENDTLTVRGVLPDKAGTYNLDLIAKVVNVKSSAYKDFATTCEINGVDTFTVASDPDHTLVTPTSGDIASYVVFTDEIAEARSNYSVLVRAPKDNKNLFTAFVQSDDTDLSTIFDLPDWLTVSNVEYAAEGEYDPESFDEAPIKSLTVTLNSGTLEVDSGDQAVVHIPFVDASGKSYVVIGWDVTYSEEAAKEPSRPFGVFGSKEVEIEFDEPGTKSPDIVYKGTMPTALITATTLSGDVTLAEPVVSDLDEETGIGFVYLPITVANTAQAGEYTATIDLSDGTETISINLTVKVAIGDTITLNQDTLDLVAGGKTKDITATVSGFKNGYNVTVSFDNANLTITNTEGSSIYTIGALEGAEEKTYEVVFTAIDSTDETISADATLNVNVTTLANLPELEITTDNASIDVVVGTPKTITITSTNNTIESLDVKIPDGAPLTETHSINDKTATVTLTASDTATRGSYSVTITAADEANKEASVTVTAKVKYAEDDIAFTLTPNPNNGKISIVAGETSSISVQSSKTVKSCTGAGLSDITAAVTSSDAKAITITFTADKGVSAGTQTYTFTATDDLDQTQTVTVTLTISRKGSNVDNTPDAIVAKISADVKNLLNKADATVIALDVENAVSTSEKSVSDFGTDAFTALDPAEVPIIVLPKISGDALEETGIYVFTISYDAYIKEAIDAGLVNVGDTIFIHMIPDGSKVSSSDKGVFVDDKGQEIAEVPENGGAGFNAAAYLTAGTDYWPVISKLANVNVLELIPDSSSFTMEADESKTITITATQAATSWDVSYDITAFTASIASTDTTAQLTLTAASNIKAGTYEIVVSAYNESKTVSAETKLTVTVAPVVLEITASSTSLEFGEGDSTTVTITANKNVKRWEANPSSENLKASIVSTDKTATITLSSEVSGDYTVPVSAYDEEDGFAELELTVKVTYDFKLSQPSNINLVAGGSEQSVTVNLTGTTSGDVSWTYSSVANLVITITSSDNTSAIVNVSADSAATAGTKTITITATDAAGKSKSVTFSAIVRRNGSDDTHDFSLSASPSSLNLTAGGSAQSVTITASAADSLSKPLTWTVTESSGLNVVRSDTVSTAAETESATFSVSAPSTATEGAKSITITATDAAGKSNSVTFNANVTHSGNGGDSEDEKTDEEKKQEFLEKNSNATPSVPTEEVVETLSESSTVTELAPAGEDVEVVSLEADAFGSERTVSDVSSSEKEAIEANNEEVVLALPVIYGVSNADKPKIYIVALNFADFYKAIVAGLLGLGDPIRVRITPLDANGASIISEVGAAATNNSNGKLVDDNGNEITKVTQAMVNNTYTGGINLAAYLEPGNDYSTVITKAEASENGLASSGAGCNGGFGSLIGALAIAFMYFKKRS